LLTSGRGDPIDDLARELEMYALALRLQQETVTSSEALQFEPMRDYEGHVRRIRLSTEHVRGMELYQQAIEAWSNLPSGVRCSLGLQVDASRTMWSNTNTINELSAILQKHNMPPQLCTISIESSTASSDELRQQLPTWRNAGFALSLLPKAGSVDSATWLHKRWFDEVQIPVPALNHPLLGATQKQLVCALIQLAKARGLKVAIRGVKKPEQLAWHNAEDIFLIAGPLIGRPVNDLSRLLLEQKPVHTEFIEP
jgi:EAL domain-containing protein (putative c-di-GMP-specific phosphodiesterase class I)